MPWRLAAYLKAEGKQAATAAGLYPAMEALKIFFEKEIHDRGEVRPISEKFNIAHGHEIVQH